MSFTIKTVKIKNYGNYYKNLPVIAEMGIEVDGLPIEAVNGSKEPQPVPGFYYATILRKQTAFDYVIKRYSISNSSVYNYYCSFNSEGTETPEEDDAPSLLEEYSSISQAYNSYFSDYFLQLDELIFECKYYHEYNLSKEFNADESTFKSEIRINSWDEFYIKTSIRAERGPDIEFCLLIDAENAGAAFGDKEKKFVIPYMRFYKVIDGEPVAESPNLEYIGNDSFFGVYLKLVQLTVRTLKEYVEKNKIREQFGEVDYYDFYNGVFCRCLGEKLMTAEEIEKEKQIVRLLKRIPYRVFIENFKLLKSRNQQAFYEANQGKSAMQAYYRAGLEIFEKNLQLDVLEYIIQTKKDAEIVKKAKELFEYEKIGGRGTGEK